jgi:glycosyltransferase involved in cell wall biosynthesis
MIRVTALTLGRDDPSSRFRVRQFIAPLYRLGVHVAESYLPIFPYKVARLVPLGIVARLPGVMASRRTDITWLRRELITGRATLERFAGPKRLFDVDDAIWLAFKTPYTERIVSHCDGVIAGNRFLADHFEKLGARVWVVPTSVDTEVWKPAPKRENRCWTIGWIGTWSNIKYLRAVEEPLADFLAQHRDSRFLLVCDRKPRLKRIPADRWQFLKWSQEREVDLLRKMDVGLMPLDDSDWARGKCAFKMLSYMAVGIPVVVSPVGVNQEILQQDRVGLSAVTASAWYEALHQLFTESEMAAEMGKRGRQVVESKYSVRRTVSELAGIFQDVAGLSEMS